MDQFKNTALELVKARIGLSTTVRDTYLEQIIASILTELTEVHGLSLKVDNPYHLMFVVDFADWRYSNRDSEKGMPRHLQFRLHNMILKKLGETNDENMGS